jgi:diaminopimelate epimerase
MTQTIKFAKLSGSGNDFVCIDNRGGRFAEMLADTDRVGHFARALCCRGTGVGADGVIFACRPEIDQVADIEARFFESDGSECELCGNGTACFTRWVTARGWVPHREDPTATEPPGHLADKVRAGQAGVKILTPAGIVLGEDLADAGGGAAAADGTYVRVCIPLPQNMATDIRLEGTGLTCDYVETGIPHAVVYVDDIDAVDVGRLGPAVRHHRRFQPGGANADFVQVIAPGEIALRTYEFGVEGETLACGTGSAAAAILTAIRFDWPEPYTTGAECVRVRSRSGDVLRVYFARQDDGIVSDVCLETVVRFVFSGSLHGELASYALGRGGERAESRCVAAAGRPAPLTQTAAGGSEAPPEIGPRSKGRGRGAGSP